MCRRWLPWARSQNPAVASDLARSLAALSVEALPSHGRALSDQGLPAELGYRPAHHAIDSDQATRTINTVAAYARSARAFCNWLVRQGYVSETPFPQDAVPKARRGLPQAVEPEAFVHLLRACQLPGSPGGQNAGMTARNRAILWLLLDTGLQVSELCGLRLTDVDRAGGTVTVRGKGGRPRTFHLSADGQRAVCAYLDQARLTPAWEPACQRHGSALAHRTAASSDQE